jgi:NADH-ubiquinone oxidoreductase chain 2
MDKFLILMMLIPSMLLFLLILFFSIFLVISSPSWLGAWVGLEVNLIRFIPVILDRRNLFSVESCLKYFLVQAFSSLIFLIALLLLVGDLNLIWYGGNGGVIAALCALIIKLGAAPFHYWLPAVAGGIGWAQNFILITFQKIAPLILSSYFINMG